MKHVLFVTYYYPPAGGSAVRRILAFSRYLPRYGWSPTVLTAQNGTFPVTIPGSESEIPDGASVVRARSWRPHSLYNRVIGRRPQDPMAPDVMTESDSLLARLARWVRANVFIPDARVGWLRPAVTAGSRVIRSRRIDVILTSGPPNTVHLVGRRLSRKHGIPWVADFRDAWRDPNYFFHLPFTNRSLLKHEALERSVYQEASAVSGVSDCLVERVTELAGDQTPVRVIRNGYDERDFAQLELRPASHFILCYAGTLSATQDCPALWDAYGSVLEDGVGNESELQLVGNIAPQVRASINAAGIEGRVSISGFESHRRALTRLHQASALLVVVPRVPNNKEIITGKLYEYMRVGLPILGVGPVDSEAAALIKQTGAGQMFDYEDAPGMEEYLRALISAFKAGGPLTGAAHSRVVAFDRARQTEQLADLLDMASDGNSNSGRAG